MSRFSETFPNVRVVLPVIHVTSDEQAMRNAKIAKEADADGVFLINHGMPDDQLLQIHETVAGSFPGWWLGVNCLGLTPEEIFQCVSPRVSGVWVDNAMINEDKDTQPYAERVVAVQQEQNWHGLYFGGVAFKYQRPVSDLAAAARTASCHMDVVTTSGPGTGQAAAPVKIRLMKEALGDFPLAIANGMTPENVDTYLPWVDCFLVATGIARTFEEFDPKRVQDLVKRVHSLRL